MRVQMIGCGFAMSRLWAATLSGLSLIDSAIPQGSSFLATLGFVAESLWDSARDSRFGLGFVAAREHDGGERMGKRRRYAVAVVVLLMVAGLIYGAFRYEAEPEYGGKSLSEWVKAYGTNYFPATYYATGVAMGNSVILKSTAADQAIRGIGTNAIPYLVKWLRYQRPAWKQSLLSAVNRLVPRWKMMDQAQVKAENSIDALLALGPDGKGAIPTLKEALWGPAPSITTIRSVDVLFRLGTDGLPPLIDALTNGKPSVVKSLIVSRIGEAGTNALAAVPALRKLQSDPRMGDLATIALWKIESPAAQRNTR